MFLLLTAISRQATESIGRERKETVNSQLLVRCRTAMSYLFSPLATYIIEFSFSFCSVCYPRRYQMDMCVDYSVLRNHRVWIERKLQIESCL